MLAGVFSVAKKTIHEDLFDPLGVESGSCFGAHAVSSVLKSIKPYTKLYILESICQVISFQNSERLPRTQSVRAFSFVKIRILSSINDGQSS
jgi:hypothetical protein